ncbi:Fe2+ transport protein [Thermococcus eurythermalis]|uniref:Fe2+ transport protein n=1 Tax=Thermococcus eurythermalis TaxID=1505907 RepID=A0A097QVD3_9EURY|nr:FeoA family protein [Thermococcus eurythermalis]AIU70436.1 Fe2+ transport protein [Thermococcus eurythermalis]
MVVPLLSLLPGERGIVVDLRGGPNFRSRLYAMGLAPGAVVRVLENYPRGPLIVEVGGTRIALGKGMAARVFVRKL